MRSPRSAPPFFVVGNPRSGTTLLRFMLSSHPRLYIPEETGFVPFLGQDPAALLSEAQVEAVLTRIGRLNHYWYNLVSDRSAFYEALPTPNLAAVLDTLYRQKMAEHGGGRWGDKTPGYVRYLPAISAIFPEAQFIHLIRDGRDATLSAQKKWGAERRYMDNYYLLKNWVSNVQAGRLAGAQLGPLRYLELRYEALVQSPEKTLGQVSRFLGEEWTPEMLDHSRTAQGHQGPDVPAEVQQPLSTASVARWQSELSPFDRRLAERIAGPLLGELGYPREGGGAWTAVDTARYLALAAKFNLTNAARRLLYATGLLTLNRGRRRR